MKKVFFFIVIILFSIVLFSQDKPPFFRNDLDTVYITSAIGNADKIEERFKQLSIGAGHGSWYDDITKAKIKYEFESYSIFTDYIFYTYSMSQTKLCGFVARKNGVLYSFIDSSDLIKFAKSDSIKLKRYPRYNPYKSGSDTQILEKEKLALEHLNNFRMNPLGFLDRLEEFYKSNPIIDETDLYTDDEEEDSENKSKTPKEDERITKLRTFRKSINGKMKLPILEYERSLDYSSMDIALEINRKTKAGDNVREMTLKELLTEKDGSKLEDRVKRYGSGKVLEIYFPATYHLSFGSDMKNVDIMNSPFYGYIERTFSNHQANIKDLKEILNPSLQFVSISCLPTNTMDGICILHLGYKNYRKNSYEEQKELE